MRSPTRRFTRLPLARKSHSLFVRRGAAKAALSNLGVTADRVLPQRSPPLSCLPCSDACSAVYALSAGRIGGVPGHPAAAQRENHGVAVRGREPVGDAPEVRGNGGGAVVGEKHPAGLEPEAPHKTFPAHTDE